MLAFISQLMRNLDCVFFCLETPHSMYSMGLFTLAHSQELHTLLEWNLSVLRMFSVKVHHNLLALGTHGIGHSNLLKSAKMCKQDTKQTLTRTLLLA